MNFTQSIIARYACALLLTGATSTTFAAETAADEPLVIEHAGPTPDQTALFFERDGDLVQIIRSNSDVYGLGRDAASTTESQGRAIVQALMDGPTEAEELTGISHFLPEGSTLGKLEVELPETIRIFLDLPYDFVDSAAYSPNFVQEAGEAFIESLRHLGYRQFLFFVKDPQTGEYRQIRELLNVPDDPAPPAPVEETTAPETAEATTRNLPTQNGFVAGALAGKNVVLNSSHGWLDDNDPSRWRVQRSRYFGLLEDFSSAMFMNHYVIPLLQNAGARPLPVREADSQTNIVVLDDSAGSPSYTESGAGWASSTAEGFVPKQVFGGNTVTSRTEDNPFGNVGGTRFNTSTAGAPTATASYNATIPADGYYNVYISYSSGANRTANAHWQVHHSGGVSDFRINQRIGGATWRLLGNFYFEQNAPLDQRKVVMLNDTGDTAIITCDAVRLGGGMGNVARGTHGVSGRPRWQEEANNYLQYNGMLGGPYMGEITDNVFYPATPAVGDYENPDGFDDEQIGWSNRSNYARWEHERDSLGDNIVSVGWHTNGLNGTTCANGIESGSTARGTGSYRAADGSANTRTVNLTSFVHNAFIASVRQSYQGSWQDRGIIKNNNYGESIQGRLGAVGGFFFEGLFHDNSADSAAYKDPKFRYAAARGIVHGLIQYYGGSVFPPEPVTNFRAKNIGNGQVQLEWTRGVFGTLPSQANGSVATGYRVFKSTNGFGFDEGTDVGNLEQFTMGLTPGETTFIRVAAVNSGGISVPSETLAVRVPTAGQSTVVIVNGYQRNDRFLAPFIAASGIGGCTNNVDPAQTYRTMDPREFQSNNYTVQHANAIAASGGYGIDSCSKDAVNLGNFNLGTYPMVFWIGGQEGEADTTDLVDDSAFSVNERNAISAYLTGGGSLFISGSELAWDTGRPAAPADEKAFLSDNLKATFTSDGSNTYNAMGNAGIFAGLGAIAYDNGSGNTYQVRFPDVIAPQGGAIACMAYSGGTGGTAAVQYTGTFGTGTTPGRLVYMGFGFETINSEPVRNNLMGRVMTFFTRSEVSDWKSF